MADFEMDFEWWRATYEYKPWPVEFRKRAKDTYDTGRLLSADYLDFDGDADLRVRMELAGRRHSHFWGELNRRGPPNYFGLTPRPSILQSRRCCG